LLSCRSHCHSRARSSNDKNSGCLNLLGLGSGETLLLSSLKIDLSKAQAGVVELNAVDELLQKHEWEANAGNYPRHGRVHLVSTSELEGRRAERIGEDLSEDRGVDLSTSLELGTNSLDRLDEVGRDKRR
jgi:hypothetical protein